MNRFLKLTSASVLALTCAVALAQAETSPVTWEDILNDAETTDDVLMYGMGCPSSEHLAQIGA
ncbi:hypothetical protein ACFSS8_13300 [Paracoccus kondratievae]